jgi:uncharacterized Zn-finger protein
MRIHTGEKPYKCKHEGCGGEFKTLGQLKGHQSRHLPEKPFQCQLCSKKFTRYSTLNNHNLIHLDLKPHKCNHESCGKSFRDKSNMKKHMKIHVNIKIILII